MAETAPLDVNLFPKHLDAHDPRLGNQLHEPAPDAWQVSVLGYPDDEGVRLNRGRTGAAGGPLAIRQFLYKTTPHPQMRLKTFRDLGDVMPTGLLPERHESGRAGVLTELQAGRQVLSLGGGNDYAYSDGAAFLSQFSGSVRPLVINIDAHLDVREPINGFNSGTPFYRLLKSEAKFDFVELGLQSVCNAKAHWDFVQEHNGQIITVEEILESGQSFHSYCIDQLGELLFKQRRPTFLAIDIDAFAWPYAAGSSAAWPLGIDPHAFWPFYTTLLHRLDVRVLGIYEVAPNLEAGPGTAKLAAQLAHRYLHEPI